ncbi:MAG: PKD domain-containing protein, partial [Longimicrobiales bacterium]
MLESQAEVDAAAGVTEVRGQVMLRGSDIVDARPLSSLRRIDGRLWIERSGLQTLEGFESLSHVGEELQLIVNEDLVSIAALSSLTHLGGLRITGSPGLTGDLSVFGNVTNTEFSMLLIFGHPFTSLGSLEGLPELRRVTGPVAVYGDFDLSPLSSLEVVGDGLQIILNALVSDLAELGSLTSIGNTLSLHGLDNLTTLTGLSSLASFDGLKLGGLPRLGSLEGLPSLTRLENGLDLQSGSPPDLSALSSLTALGTLQIRDTPQTQLDFLSQLTTVDGEVAIRLNDRLTDLDALSSLESVGGGFRIQGNAVLANLDGLSNLTSVQGSRFGFGLTITENPSLSDCSGIRRLIEAGGVVEPISVADNAPGCNSLEEILGNTRPGTNVAVANPTDRTTGEASPVTVTFAEVTAAGETTVASGTVGQGGPPAPGGFRLGQPPTFFDVETTASFVGTVEICIDYSGLRFGNENAIRLMHHDETSGWEDVTTSRDSSNDIVCGTTSSLSPFLVAEQNVAPEVTSVILPSDPLALGDAAGITARFTDANPDDVHTATIDWGDGTRSAGVVIEPSGDSPGTVTGQHVYAAAGVYTVTVTVTEDVDPGYDLSGSRSSAVETAAFVVVFDPGAGFVTGGGWIDSPPGAMPE